MKQLLKIISTPQASCAMYIYIYTDIYIYIYILKGFIVTRFYTKKLLGKKFLSRGCFFHSWTAFKNLSTLCFCFTSWSVYFFFLALFINWKPLHTLFSTAVELNGTDCMHGQIITVMLLAHVCLVLFSRLGIVNDNGGNVLRQI